MNCILKIEEFTDEQCIELFQELLAKRIKLGTAYVQDPESGILTHQFLVMTCGEERLHSASEPLALPLMPVVAQNKVTIN